MLQTADRVEVTVYLVILCSSSLPPECDMQERIFMVRNEGGASQFWLSAAELADASLVEVNILPDVAQSILQTAVTV